MKEKNRLSQTKDVFWNMLGGGIVALQSAVLLIFVARFYNQDAAGIVSISYAFAVLAFTIARYGIRNYQVTDQQSEYSFNEYLFARYISVAVTILLICVYLAIQTATGNYSLNKSVVVLEIVLLRMVNAIEDVFLGRFQQVGKFGVGAKIMAIRETFLLILLILLLVMKIDLRIAVLVGIIFSSLVDVIYIYVKKADMDLDDGRQRKANPQAVGKLLRENFPLCIGTALAVYASNIPKYTTDWYLDEYSQAVVAYLILPVFTIALFSQFAYTPFVKDLGEAYHSDDKKSFLKKIRFQILFTAGVAIVICAVCLSIGLPILSYVYNIDLSVHRLEFVLLLVGGTLYALEYYLSIPVTIMHKQKQLGMGYALAIIIAAITQKRMVTDMGIMGVCILYCIINLVILLFFAAVVIMDLKTNKKN